MMSSIASFETPKHYNAVERVYVHLKVNKARWVPDPQSENPSLFVTGSYAELNNSVDLWSRTNDDDQQHPCDGTAPPRSICSVSVDGDVNQLKFVDSRQFLALTGSSQLRLYKINDGRLLEETKKWDKTETSCNPTNLSTFDELNGVVALATGDGQVLCFPVSDSLNSPSTLINPGKDVIRTVAFVKHNELAIGNLRGQISLWDLRENLFSPAMSFPYNADSAIGVTQLCPFPTQKHILIASGYDGTLSTWDLRNVAHSQTIFAAHTKLVSDLRFHPTRPGNAFTCSFAGDVWHWTNFDEMLGASVSSKQSNLPGDCKPNVLSLLPEKRFPANCVDVAGDVLLSSFDNDLLVFIKPLQLK